jgi:hypothetical protein
VRLFLTLAESASQGKKLLCCGRLGRWMSTPNFNRVQARVATLSDSLSLQRQHYTLSTPKPRISIAVKPKIRIFAGAKRKASQLLKSGDSAH